MCAQRGVFIIEIVCLPLCLPVETAQMGEGRVTSYDLRLLSGLDAKAQVPTLPLTMLSCWTKYILYLYIPQYKGILIFTKG